MTKTQNHPARNLPFVVGVALACACTGCGNPGTVEWGVVGDSLTGTLVSPTYPSMLITELNLEPAALVADGRGGRPASAGPGSVQALVANYPNLQMLIFFLGGADIVDFVAEFDPDLTRDLDDPADGIAADLANVLDVVSSDVGAALDHATAAGLTVWVVTYPPVPAPDQPCLPFGGQRLSAGDAERAQRYVAELNVMLRAQADRVGAGIIDFEMADPLGTDANNYADCLHPSPQGAAVMAEVMARVILAR